MKSKLFDYNKLQQSEKFRIKQYKDSIYRGELNGRKREGLGVIVYKNGRFYEGEWVNDLRSGQGFEMYANENTYLGGYLEGKAHGKGIYIWANGE